MQTVKVYECIFDEERQYSERSYRVDPSQVCHSTNIHYRVFIFDVPVLISFTAYEFFCN